nr:cytochrome P450 [Paris polyphylla]
MLFHFGRVPTIIVSSAAMAQEVMKTHDLPFSSRPSSKIFSTFSYNHRGVVFTPYGEYWRQVRRICVHHLLSPKRVQSFRSVREEEIKIMVDKIRSRSDLGPIDLSEIMITFTSDTTCRVAFGRKYLSKEGGGSGARELLDEFVALLGKFPVGDFIPGFSWFDRWSGLDARVRKTFKEFDTFINKVVEDHIHGERSHDGEDFVDVLLSRDEGSHDTTGFSLSRESIKALILDMFAAGTEDIFTVLEWIMAELIRHPESMKRVQEEARSIDVLKEEDLDNMRYLKAVIKEALRLHPPIPLLVPRESTEDVRLCGYDIPAKTRIMVNAWAIARDPGLWDRPDEFLPDRFMDSSIDFKGHDFKYIPFGAGRRGCPGIGYSIPTIELALANLLRHFDWALPNGEMMDISETSGMATHKKSSLVLVAKPLL